VDHSTAGQIWRGVPPDLRPPSLPEKDRHSSAQAATVLGEGKEKKNKADAKRVQPVAPRHALRSRRQVVKEFFQILGRRS
jgi:hypothetical protein